YAARRLPSILAEFEAANTDSCVGPIYLLELDEYSLSRCLASIPLRFRSRIVTPTCPNYSVGMSGDSPNTVLADSRFWEYDVMQSAEIWLAGVEARSEPGLLVVLVSRGVSAALGWPPAKAWKARYPRKPVYCVSILDAKTPVRERFPEIRALYALDNLT